MLKINGPGSRYNGKMMITFYKPGTSGSCFYYTVHDRQGSLFTSYSLTVIWGRALDRGKEKVYAFENRAEIDAKIRDLIRQRIRKGYKVLYSYFRGLEERRLFASASRDALGIRNIS